jgi:hypothetical protein
MYDSYYLSSLLGVQVVVSDANLTATLSRLMERGFSTQYTYFGLTGGLGSMFRWLNHA